MSDTTFNQFQAKIRDAQKRIQAHGEQFVSAVNTLPGSISASLDELVVVDAEELKKLEAEMGTKLKEEFKELTGSEEVEEPTEEETPSEVEKTD
jgi:hypothetical protein